MTPVDLIQTMGIGGAAGAVEADVDGVLEMDEGEVPKPPPGFCSHEIQLKIDDDPIPFVNFPQGHLRGRG
jgi:hypothetical protein